jgi:hypothetical protein
MSMPLTTGAGLDMPYSATPVRRAVSDIPWQLEKIDKSTVRNGGLGKRYWLRCIVQEPWKSIATCQIALPLSIYPSCSGSSSPRSFKGEHAGLVNYIVCGRAEDQNIGKFVFPLNSLR